MPVYEYQCSDCGVFDRLCALSAFAEPAACPSCGAASPRILSMPRLAVISPHQRKAHETNERSRHEPKVHKSCCSSGSCSHHTKPAAKAATGSAPILKAPAGSRRPWMISH